MRETLLFFPPFGCAFLQSYALFIYVPNNNKKTNKDEVSIALSSFSSCSAFEESHKERRKEEGWRSETNGTGSGWS